MIVKYTFNDFHNFSIHDKNIYACCDDKKIIKIDTSTGMIETLCDLSYRPEYIVYFKDHLFLSDGFTIDTFDLNTATLDTIYMSGTMKTIKTGTDHVYFKESKTNHIYQLSLYGNTKLIVSDPNCIAFDSFDEFVYILCSDSNLYVYDVDGLLFHNYEIAISNVNDIATLDNQLYFVCNNGFSIMDLTEFTVIFQTCNYCNIEYMKRGEHSMYFICNHSIHQVHDQVITELDTRSLKPLLPDVNAFHITSSSDRVYFEENTKILVLQNTETYIPIQDLAPGMFVRVYDKGYIAIKDTVLQEYPSPVYKNDKLCISTAGVVNDLHKSTSNLPFYGIVLQQNSCENQLYVNGMLVKYYNHRK